MYMSMFLSTQYNQYTYNTSSCISTTMCAITSTQSASLAFSPSRSPLFSTPYVPLTKSPVFI
jgi:hypothetical protein